MATKYQIAERVIRMAVGGDRSQDTVFDIREVLPLVESALNNILRTDYFNLLGTGEKAIDGTFIATFTDVDVEFDPVRCVMQAKLPSHYLRLPKNMGVHLVAPAEEEWNAFIPLNSGMITLLRGSYSFELEGQEGFTVEGNKIIIYTKNKLLQTVMVKLVIPAANTGEDEDLGLPADIENQVIAQVMQLLLPMQNTRQDKTPDNNKGI